MRVDRWQGSRLRTHPQQLLREVPTLVDASVHGDEALGRGLVTHIVVVQAGVEHDDGKGEYVARICNTTDGVGEGRLGLTAVPHGRGPGSAATLPPWQDVLPALRAGSYRGSGVMGATGGREHIHLGAAGC